MTEEERVLNYKNNLFKLAINMYMVGDFIGYNHQHGNISQSNKITLDDSIKEMNSIEPTERSEIAFLFTMFSELFNTVTDWDKFISNWCIYMSEKSTKNVNLEFINLIKKMRGTKKVNLNKIYSTAQTNSLYDNDCLSLVYPIYNFSINQHMNLNAGLKLNLDICKLTHYHTLAIGATSILYCIIDNALTFKHDIFDSNSYLKYDGLLSVNNYMIPWLMDFLNSEIQLPSYQFTKIYENNKDACSALLCSLYCVKNSNDVNETIRMALNNGGDVGAILPLSLMLSVLHNTSKANYLGASVDVAPLNIPHELFN